MRALIARRSDFIVANIQARVFERGGFGAQPFSITVTDGVPDLEPVLRAAREYSALIAADAVAATIDALREEPADGGGDTLLRH